MFYSIEYKCTPSYYTSYVPVCIRASPDFVFLSLTYEEKRNSSGGKQGDDTGEGVDPALLRFLTAMKHDLMDSTREAVGKIETRLERQEATMANLERRVDRSEKEMTDRIAAEVSKQIAVPRGASPALSKAASTKREASFHYCRRSLKLWPVEGEDLQDATRQFLKNKLGMTDARIELLGQIEVASVPGRMARERKEILATFETREDRDGVKANGVRLAGQREVGMSIHVPGYLMDNFTALNSLGYSIKQKNPDTKRSVKFDDNKQDLYLDACIGGQWRRIGPQEAKQVLKAVPSANSLGMSITVEELTALVREKKGEEEEQCAVVVPDDTMED